MAKEKVWPLKPCEDVARAVRPVDMRTLPLLVIKAPCTTLMDDMLYIAHENECVPIDLRRPCFRGNSARPVNAPRVAGAHPPPEHCGTVGTLGTRIGLRRSGWLGGVVGTHRCIVAACCVAPRDASVRPRPAIPRESYTHTCQRQSVQYRCAWLSVP